MAQNNPVKHPSLILSEFALAEIPKDVDLSEYDRRRIFYEFMSRLSDTFYTLHDFELFVERETKVVLTYHI